MKILRKYLRYFFIILPNKFKLKNKTPSIIASNCNGGFIYHDLGLKFYSPTINLFFYPDDFLKFIKNLKYYLSLKLLQVDDSNLKWPVGILDDVKIQFMHYKSFEEAEEKWNKRAQRVNFNNLFFIWTDRDGINYEQIKEFDKLPLKNKVIFTAKECKEIKCSFQIKAFKNKNEVGILSNFKRLSYKRYLDDFDYVRFLNKK